MNGTGQNSPHFFVLLLTAPEQHQNHIRYGLRSLWTKPHRHTIRPCAAKASHCNSSEDDVSVYGRVQLPWQLVLIWLSSWMGPRKSSAAFIFPLIVYEHNFYCLVQTIFMRTKNGSTCQEQWKKQTLFKEISRWYSRNEELVWVFKEEWDACIFDVYCPHGLTRVSVGLEEE